ncbi:alpha/beta hydrolase [Phenylobacterium sp.]|uniref:alpha/beta hydrolase n=1 Tax=Phenylobacterium sp. TaxID=1871053 RepID=UPI002E351611|nr:alpha/beta hydrolase-fold protein [Phenylobacterium sp.]HEX3364333.1 alpha/beta hydrolase-fold protein [Phenylobacterium sp.]
MRRLTAVILALGLSLAASPAPAEALKVVSENPPIQPGYNRFVLHSDRIGRDFAVTVNTPSATVFLPGQKLPAIYALDSGYGLAGPQGMLLGNTGAMEPAIIVSVGYLPGQTLFRNTDLLHNKLTQDGVTIGGGGAAFEAFLLEDLKPFVEAKFPADPARSVLFGHSFGGLFAANVFADKPDAFYGYVIGSASVWADPPVAARVAAAMAHAHGQRVYLSVGEKEGWMVPGGSSQMTDGFSGLMAAMTSKPGVILKTQLYAGETHLSYYPRLVTDGFPHVLPPAMALGASQTVLTPEVLARYLGVYSLPDGRKVTITRQSRGDLAGQVSGIPQVPLQQNGADRFYAPTSDLNVTFDKSGLTMVGVDGGTVRATRDKTP